MSYADCIRSITQAAGRDLSDKEVAAIYERVHKAALDIKAGRASAADIYAGKKVQAMAPQSADDLVRAAAERAAADLIHEAQVRERQALLQVVKSAGVLNVYESLRDAGLSPMDAVRAVVFRDFGGRANIQSLEQRVEGIATTALKDLHDTWDALGRDWLGFFQDRNKLLNLVRELLSEDSGDPVAKKGAAAYHKKAEELRLWFNSEGGDIGHLDDWGMPRHHSQQRIALAGKDAFVNYLTPILERTRAQGKYYLDDLGIPWTNERLREFVGAAYDNIASNGILNRKPGETVGRGKIANRHSESRQIHFPDAESQIAYWERFGDKAPVEILHDHIRTMARDIAMLEIMGPNDLVTFRTLLDTAAQDTVKADQTKTEAVRAEMRRLERYYNYSTGRVNATTRPTFSAVVSGIMNLARAGMLGGAAQASFFGDRAMLQAVAHLDNIPQYQAWRAQIGLLNPLAGADRRALQRNGLMLDAVSSGLTRFYDGIAGGSSFERVTGKLANAVLRASGMTAINEIPKAAFGALLFDSIGREIKSGKSFAALAESDVRTLRSFGVTEADWKVWQLAKLDDIGHGAEHALLPENIEAIPDDALRNAGIEKPTKARRDAVVKLLGAVNTESEFAIVTPGWLERAQMYSAMQRGTVIGEIGMTALQFKSFPFTMFKRFFDATMNKDGWGGRAAMAMSLATAMTLAGAMLIETRQVMSGKDPREAFGDDWMKFWGSAFIQGGSLGIYGDFLYGITNTRHGSGWAETLSGPIVGPLLEMSLIQPAKAIKRSIEGKETHLMAETARDLKQFFPGANFWPAKAALDNMLWANVFEALSPGYIADMRSRTMREYGQDSWWRPGELTPDRAPDFGAAIQR